MRAFVHEALPGRVVFGAGTLERLPDEIDRLGARRVLLITTAGQRERMGALPDLLGERLAGIYDRALTHVPAEIADEARAEAARLGADCCVAFGGGSTIGVAKAVALTAALPILAIPTTYSGSEMTPIWGITSGGVKQTGRDRRVLPRVVIYDPALTLSLPPQIAGPSGVNAIAHCVEALYAPDASPIAALMAEEGARALAASLPLVVREPGNQAARSDALYGAWLAATSLAAVTMGLHHKLCHTLGGSFNLPHAETHTVILPHAVAYNRSAAPEAMRRLARALGAEDAPAAIYDLAVAIGAPTSLAQLGMRVEDLQRAAVLATRDPYANPAPVNAEKVTLLLEDAYAGRRPAQ